MFERAGYSISLSPEVSPLALPPQPIVVGDLVVDAMHRTDALRRDRRPRSEAARVRFVCSRSSRAIRVKSSRARTYWTASGRATMTATSAPSTSTSLASAAASVRRSY